MVSDVILDPQQCLSHNQKSSPDTKYAEGHAGYGERLSAPEETLVRGLGGGNPGSIN